MISQPPFQFSAGSSQWVKRGTIALISLLALAFESAPLHSSPLPSPEQSGRSLVAEALVSQAASPPAAAVSPRPLLKPGSQGETVSELQAMLRLLGYYSGAIDGVYQDSTASAVAAFQQAAGLQPDGIVGTETWVRLLPPSPVASATSAPAARPVPSATASSATASSPTASSPTSGSRSAAASTFPSPTATPAASPPASLPPPSAFPSPTASPVAPAVRSPAATVPAAPASPAPTASPSVAPTPTPVQTGVQTGAQTGAQTGTLAVATVDFPILRVGMRGAAVSGLQARLQAIGVFGGAIDGVFGTETQDAVKAAQQKFNLESDGVVGSATWAALMQ